MGLRWKRTSNNEYPENGEEVIFFFAYTGYSLGIFIIENFTKEEAGIFGIDQIFYFCDEGGFLGEEDVLWISVKEAKDHIGEYLPPLTEEYVRDYPECVRYYDRDGIL